ncbi:MAG: hypothetical protein Q7T05_03865 [Dehalococcoidia bacterium]|nr:hypothetical protein [Dehalococcoidia bacterium]
MKGVRIELESEDLRPMIEAYKEQFGRAKHLDWLAVTLFIVVAVLAIGLLLLIIAGIVGDGWSERGALIVVLALTAGGTHAIVAISADRWITFAVISQMTRGLGLVSKGVFPPSLLTRTPADLCSFANRLAGGFQGSLLLLLLVLGSYAVFLVSRSWLGVPLAFGFAPLPPLIFSVISVAFSYNRLQHRLVSLRRYEELALAAKDDLVTNHCNLAEALLLLDPPRLAHARKQYELALELIPDNLRAKEGLQRLAGQKRG